MKKTRIWLAVAAVLLGATVVVCFLMAPKEKEDVIARWDGVYTTGRVLAQVPELSSLGNNGAFDQIVIQNRGLTILSPEGETIYNTHEEGSYNTVTAYSQEALADFLKHSGMVWVEKTELPVYRIVEDMQVYHYHRNGNEKETVFHVYYCKGQPIWLSEGDNKRLYELVPSTRDLQYGPKEAKKDGCVVFTDLSLTAGEKVWKEFLKSVEKGKYAKVRLAYYYEEEQVMYLEDLLYDTENFILYEYVNGKTKKSDTFPYLKRIEGKDEDPFSQLDEYVYYVLLKEEDAIDSREDIMKRFASSLSTDLTGFKVVYTDLTCREAE